MHTKKSSSWLNASGKNLILKMTWSLLRHHTSVVVTLIFYWLLFLKPTALAKDGLNAAMSVFVHWISQHFTACFFSVLQSSFSGVYILINDTCVLRGKTNEGLEGTWNMTKRKIQSFETSKYR